MYGLIKIEPIAVAAVLLASSSASSLEQSNLRSASGVEVVDGELVLTKKLVFIEDTGAANRIVAGDLLRVLSQEIPSAACHLHNEVSTEEATQLLSLSVAKFSAVAEALLNGNEQMGILGAEERLKTRLKIESIMADWHPVEEAARKVLADPSDDEAVQIIYDSTDDMMEKTYILLSELEGQYSNPVELLQSDVLLLEVSGRMAAMTQRIAYEACRVWSGDADEEYTAALLEAKGIFDASLTALTHGMPELGIKPAPNDDIATALNAIAQDWDVVSSHLRAVLSDTSTADSLHADLYQRLADKLFKAEELIELYQAYSKRVY